MTKAVRHDLDQLRGVFNDLPEPAIVRALIAWSALFGTVSFELFGEFHNVISTHDDYFDLAMAELGAFVGLPSRPQSRRRSPAA